MHTIAYYSIIHTGDSGKDAGNIPIHPAVTVGVRKCE